MQRQVSCPAPGLASARGITTLPDAAECGRVLCMTLLCALCRIAAPHLPKVLRPLPGASGCEVETTCVAWGCQLRGVAAAVKLL
jgi:hypothetical protein